MRRVLLVGFVLALVPITPASAAITTRVDSEGRTIRFAVGAPNVDVDRFADALRASVHGNEITRVTIRIVPSTKIRRLCGRGAIACYAGSRRSGRITVAATGPRLEETLLHEYGHHIDASRPHRGGHEPNGTRRWFAARRIGPRLRSGALRRDYSRGWQRSVAEVFAEDYVQLNRRGPWRLRSVKAPSATVLNALRRDLTG